MFEVNICLRKHFYGEVNQHHIVKHIDLLTVLLYFLKRNGIHVNLDASPISIWKYSWPLNNKNVNCKGSLICKLFFFFANFLSSKYYNTTWSVVDWICRYQTISIEEPHIQNVDYKLYSDFQLCRSLEPLIPKLYKGQL